LSCHGKPQILSSLCQLWGKNRLDSTVSRDFALDVVRRLQSHGFVAYWVGGCVRDQLLGGEVKDYDVATDATPDDIRQLFGPNRTLGVGAAFGVMIVRGPRGVDPIEVATFRCDADYSDGRRPDSVSFSSPQEDARRRDFTINGIFYDPVTDQLVDYVNGQQDLQDKIVRSIGDADKRLDEDKLRMLRAVRFAATFNFQLDEATARAILSRTEEIKLVSAERIGDELRRMMGKSSRLNAIQLLIDTRLMTVLLPEFDVDSDWPLSRGILSHLDSDRFSVTLAACIHPIGERTDDLQTVIRDLSARWRLSNEEIRETSQLVRAEGLLRTAHQLAWSKVQPVLAGDLAQETMRLAAAIAAATGETAGGIELCREKLLLPIAQLDPPPLLTGEDLIQLGVPRGPVYKSILNLVRDRQLDGEIGSLDEAASLARRIWEESTGG
jgi:poly(A) polymerase